MGGWRRSTPTFLECGNATGQTCYENVGSISSRTSTSNCRSVLSFSPGEDQSIAVENYEAKPDSWILEARI
jgi:hypothetical protein